MANAHEYAAHLQWTGNSGSGTADYRSYRREYRVVMPGKPAVTGSADPHFLGDASLVNPEEMLLSALSACHMLFYLALCAKAGVRVERYEDRSSALLTLDAGSGAFDHAVLRPVVYIADGSRLEQAQALHETAHAHCFIARSVNFPVRFEPEILVVNSSDKGRR